MLQIQVIAAAWLQWYIINHTTRPPWSYWGCNQQIIRCRSTHKSEASRMGRDDPQFNLRLPYELKEKLKQRAKSNGRSLNSELVQIVTDAVSKPSKFQAIETMRNASLMSSPNLLRRWCLIRWRICTKTTWRWVNFAFTQAILTTYKMRSIFNRPITGVCWGISWRKTGENTGKTAEYTKRLAHAAVRKTILPPSRTTKGFHNNKAVMAGYWISELRQQK